MTLTTCGQALQPLFSNPVDGADAAAQVGRPRRFDAETERRMLLDAAVRVMARNGYLEMTVSDVLSGCGLSTRAFYRHFDTKDSLLLTLLRRESDSVGRSLAAAVNEAPDPVSALEAWLDRYLDVFYEPRRAARTALFASPAVRATVGFDEAMDHVRRFFAAPLIEALRAGHEADVLHSPDPSVDAATMLSAVLSVTDPREMAFADREAAAAHVRRFCWPAFCLSALGGHVEQQRGGHG